MPGLKRSCLSLLGVTKGVSHLTRRVCAADFFLDGILRVSPKMKFDDKLSNSILLQLHLSLSC